MMDRHGARLTRIVIPADCGVRVDRSIKMRMIMRIIIYVS